RLDDQELTTDPNDSAVGELVRDPITPAHARIDLRVRASRAFRPPPCRELLARGPRFEESRCARRDYAPNDQADVRRLCHRSSLVTNPANASKLSSQNAR